MKRQCKDYEFLITSYIEGDSEEPEKREVFLHVAECDSCRSYWEIVLAMKMHAAQEKRYVAPSSLDRRTKIAALRNVRMQRIFGASRNLLQRRFFVPAPAAILLALFFLLGGAGAAILWSSKTKPMKESIETVVYMKLPTVEVRGTVEQHKSTTR